MSMVLGDGWALAVAGRWLADGLGLEVPAAQLTTGQMAARAAVTFAFSLVLVQLAGRRFVGHNASYDVMLGVVLGSVLSRAVNGQAAFGATFAACAVLVLLHRLVSLLACRFHWVSLLVKGRAPVVIRDGAIDRRVLRRSAITPDDLLQSLRLNGNTDDPAAVREARLERNGEISVIKRL